MLISTSANVLLLLIFSMIDESFKAGLVYLTRKSILVIPAILALPAIEIYMDYDIVFDHVLALGADPAHAQYYSIIFFFGSKLFHIATSVFYLLSSNILLYVVCISIVHFFCNIVAEYYPPLPLPYYLAFPWILTLGAITVISVFHMIAKRRRW